MTIKLYDLDSHLREFEGLVMACYSVGEYYHIVLDQTAFFPTGGGQPADTGTLDNIPVLDVSETSQGIIHCTNMPIAVGAVVLGNIDWNQRFRRMQNHSGEHIVSGLINQLYGYDNVGFHMGSKTVTIDYNGILTREDFMRIEYLANEAVVKNIAVAAYYPTPEELSAMNYRSKLELTENVRIVAVEGYDTCACCAPHVSNTGEIGLIKLLDLIQYKGGVRINMLCGFSALDDYNGKFEQVAAISRMLSSKQDKISSAVEKLQNDMDEVKQKFTSLNQKLAQAKMQTIVKTTGNLVIFESEIDTVTLREMVNMGMQFCGSICAAFSGEDGCYRYIIGSTSVDLKARAKEINRSLNGRGGGSTNMIQGCVYCTKKEIETYFR
jgi:alanyl-tRNA synthetase